LDLKTYNDSKLWWLGAGVRLLAAKNALDAEIDKMNCIRLSMLQSAGDEAQSAAIEAVLNYESTLKPWHRSNKSLTSNEAIDLAALYYLRFYPDKVGIPHSV
jgi:hypothetical protein